VEMCKFTGFGLCVKDKLLRMGKEQKWLEEEVTKLTGKFMDSGYMYKILTGQRNAPKIVQAICEIIEIELPALNEKVKVMQITLHQFFNVS